MKKSDRKKLYALIEQWTRAEIIARCGRFDNLEFLDYAKIEIEKRDEIRKLMFDTSNLIQLGIKWGIIKDKQLKRKKERIEK